MHDTMKEGGRGADEFLLPILFSQVSPVYSEEQLHEKPCSLVALVQLPSF